MCMHTRSEHDSSTKYILCFSFAILLAGCIYVHENREDTKNMHKKIRSIHSLVMFRKFFSPSCKLKHRATNAILTQVYLMSNENAPFGIQYMR